MRAGSQSLREVRPCSVEASMLEPRERGVPSGAVLGLCGRGCHDNRMTAGSWVQSVPSPFRGMVEEAIARSPGRQLSG